MYQCQQFESVCCCWCIGPCRCLRWPPSLICLQRADKLVIDVTGPSARDDVTDDVTGLELPPDDVTLVHVSDVRTLLSTQATTTTSSSSSSSSAEAVSDQLPLVIYVERDELAKLADGHVTLLQMLPSVNALQHNELCRLGHAPARFTLRQHGDVTFVVFINSQSATRTSRYQLSIICDPVDGGHAHHRPFTLYLHVQLV